MIVSPLIATTFIRTIAPTRTVVPSTVFKFSPVSHFTPFRSTPLRNFHLSASTQQTMYWNRETSKPTAAFEGDVIKEARIIALSDPNDEHNEPLYKGDLPGGSSLLAVGATVADFDKEEIIAQKPNVIFVSHPNSREPLVELLNKFPTVEWVHTRSAGIDFIASDGECSINICVV